MITALSADESLSRHRHRHCVGIVRGYHEGDEQWDKDAAHFVGWAGGMQGGVAAVLAHPRGAVAEVYAGVYAGGGWAGTRLVFRRDNDDAEQDNNSNSNSSPAEQPIVVRVRARERPPAGVLGVTAAVPEELRYYWAQRHTLFRRFDSGVWLDAESLFSVTPEAIAEHHASRLAGLEGTLVIDAFCGAGGNSIQFALAGASVIAIDISPVKLTMAAHNAGLYGVRDQIQFRPGDFLALCASLPGELAALAVKNVVVFLSPPWGGPGYKDSDLFDIETMLLPVPASALVQCARRIAHHATIALFLPKNANQEQCIALANPGQPAEVELNYLGAKLKAITVYVY
jgi:predicted RNA methylase